MNIGIVIIKLEENYVEGVKSVRIDYKVYIHFQEEMDHVKVVFEV